MEAAFFDLDKTVIARASMVAFGAPLYREGLISRRVLLRALYGQLVYLHLGASEQKLARMRESVLTLTKGWHQDRIREIVRETLEEVVEPISYAEALEEIEEHQRQGRRVYLVSASPEEIVEPLAEYLGVHGAIASRPRVDEDNRYTGEMAFYAYGPFKAEAMQELAEAEGIDLAGSWAYSDSYTDAPMLEVVGHPVAVNPDRVLAKLARERDWEVRQWVHTVRLRERRTPPGGAPTVAVGAVGVAALAAAGVWWGLSRRGRSSSPPSGDGLAGISLSDIGDAVDVDTLRRVLAGAGASARPLRRAAGQATGAVSAAAAAGLAFGLASAKRAGEISRRAVAERPRLRALPGR
ncbi:MAG TPA: HAD-IB family hydrolase [Acidimicrobiales bacterium]|nr:HAD-IB family hydrolase [Acidimicrobiales bacterium]